MKSSLNRQFCLILFMLSSLALMAQDNVGIGTATPNANAILELFANDKGLLTPRLTTPQRLGMGPLGIGEAGLLVYDSDDQAFYYWDGIQWVRIPTLNDGDWIINGPDMYSGVPGNVGIGTVAPTAPLHTLGDLRFEGLPLGTDNEVLVIDPNGNISIRTLGTDIWDGDQVNDPDSVTNNELNVNLSYDSLSQTLSLTDSGGTLTTHIGININDADPDPTNEWNLNLNYDSISQTLSITDAGGTLTTPIGININDADPDPTNELNININYDSITQTLSITDAGGTISTPIGININDADSDPTNEWNLSLNYDSITQTLSITDAGGTLAVNIPASTIFSIIAGDGLSGGGNTGTIILHANARNGLYVDAVADSIKLGGPLTENTYIDQSAYNMFWDLTGNGQFEVLHTGTATLAVTNIGTVGINTNTTSPQAALQVNSTSQGILIPHVDTWNRNQITNPEFGLIIYNIDDSVMQHWNGICWLPMYMENCNDCDFELEIADSLGVINHTTIDTVSTTITVTQTNGNPTTIGLFLLHNLPNGSTAFLDSFAINSSGVATLSVTADIFSTPGTYPILVQAVCDAKILTELYLVQIDSCFEVTISNNFTDYDLQLLNGLPGPGNPICVIVNVQQPVNLDGNNNAAFASGNLDPLSHVGLINEGRIFGRGGDGGAGGNFSTFGNPGEDGGNAIDLSCQTTIQNTGFIFGGGGGGGSVGVGFNIPVVGNFSIGAGGGGGAPNGLGGNIALPFLYDPGQNATGGINGAGGAGGLLNVPIPIPIGPVTVTVTPNVFGGDGGGYGIDGTDGSLFANIQVQVPIIGTIFNGSFPNPPPSLFPPGGVGGFAIKRNNNLLNGLPDGNYQTFSIKGQIGP